MVNKNILSFTFLIKVCNSIGLYEYPIPPIKDLNIVFLLYQYIDLYFIIFSWKY